MTYQNSDNSGLQKNEMREACRAYLKNIDRKLNYLTPSELKLIIDKDPNSVFILDNRTPEAFARGHIPGAINVWLKDVLDDENLPLLPKDRRIVVCCWVGHTASQLVSLLGILGYDAVGLKYGMGESAIKGELKLGWEELSFPTQSG